MAEQSHELNFDLVTTLCDKAAMEVLDLQRFYTLCQRAVVDYSVPDDPGIPIELGRQAGHMSIYMEDTSDLKEAFLARTLPSYSVILLVSVMESLFDTLRNKASLARRKKSREFRLPVPKGIPKDQVNAALFPLIAQYLELKYVRNILVHNRGIVDEKFLQRVGHPEHLAVGKEYPLSPDYCWQSFRNSLDLITVFQMLWGGTVVISRPQCSGAVQKTDSVS